MKADNWNRIAGATLLLLVALAHTLHAEQKAVVGIDDVDVGELRSESFQVNDRADIRISAIGAERSSGEGMFAYPWIINAKTRELVWSMDQDFTEPVKGSDWLREFDEDVAFKPGRYELYYYVARPFAFAFSTGNYNYNFNYNGDKKDLDKLDEDIKDLLNSLGSWLKEGKGNIDSDELRKLVRKLGVTVYAEAGEAAAATPVNREAIVVSLTHPENDAYLSQGFSLSAPVELSLYGVGEYYSSDQLMVDWGWIIDAKTRDRVWEMNRRNTDWAGGASKNRVCIDKETLAAGNYVAFYACDDSHTYGDWNAPPPYDPEGYGLQISLVNPADKDKVSPYEDSEDLKPLVRITRVGDNELISEGFRVESPTKLRIYALGEYDRFSDEMADYAWIIDKSSGRKFWVMQGSNTQSAGGASKNRLFDGVVEFNPGDYVVYYSSDGSHSYGDGWNAAPPYDQKSYGVTIANADPDAPVTAIRIENVAGHRADALAEIIGVRDDEERQARFSLVTPTRLNIHAVGEGTRYGMSDYGWIENARTGEVVWEMTYRKTSHAGGAEKNRVVDQAIILDKGEYIVYYITDDSHATGDWNATPPDDPGSWGIILTRAERDGE